MEEVRINDLPPSSYRRQISAIFGPRYSPQQKRTSPLFFLLDSLQDHVGLVENLWGKSTDLPWNTFLLVIRGPQKVRNEVVMDAISNPDYSRLRDYRPALDY